MGKERQRGKVCVWERERERDGVKEERDREIKRKWEEVEIEKL